MHPLYNTVTEYATICYYGILLAVIITAVIVSALALIDMRRD